MYVDTLAYRCKCCPPSQTALSWPLFGLKNIFPIGVVCSQEEGPKEEVGSGSESGLRAILARNSEVQVHKKNGLEGEM